MEPIPDTPVEKRSRLTTAGLAAAGVIVGVIIAGTVSAQAADPTPTPTPSVTSGQDGGPGGLGRPDGRDCPEHDGTGPGGGGGSFTPDATTPAPSQSGASQT